VSPPLVTDGVLRDVAGVRGTGPSRVVPGRGGPAVRGRPHLRELERAHRCGGVAVFPDDVVVVDDDGAVLIPQALVAEMVATAPEQERLEGWIMSEVEKARRCPGLYPPNAENKARYEATKGRPERARPIQPRRKTMNPLRLARSGVAHSGHRRTVALLAAGTAFAQYPTKSIKLIVPYPPGGATT